MNNSMTVMDDTGPIEAPIARIVIGHIGPSANHNLICWFCDKNPAVYDMHPNWFFRPCWTCQKLIDGKPIRWWQFWKKSGGA